MSLFIRATGKYEKVELGNESVDQFCKRKCFEKGAPPNTFDFYDNWKQLFHNHFENHVVCGDNIYKIFDVDENPVGLDYGSIIGTDTFDIIYMYPNYSLRDAFQINK